ncbi:mitoguardin 1-like [Denticeps clupeoides]|uniref:Mitoguardin 1 n=1 Tax=Denticeps clupeoides TaxID=299321 RepID=A0AAY4BAW0_9TELE|nr:mitoguardin 1-like [Denticeps clupeoides]
MATMAMMEVTLKNSPLSIKMAALRVVDLPLSVCSSLGQVSISSGTKKLLAATAFGAISLILLARRFQRRKGKKNALSPWQPETFDLLNTVLSEKGGNVSGGRLSGSLQSLASLKSINTASASCFWERGTEEPDVCSMVTIPVTTPENLYMMGMELFEEAVRRWEQALRFRSRHAEDEDSCASVKLGDAIAQEAVEDLSAEFIHRLESLLQRAYRLQEEFEGALGLSDPASHASADQHTDISAREDLDESCLRDSISIASTDSFVSAAELSENRDLRGTHVLGARFYQEALQLAEEGKISCRVLRTELLECLGDADFLAKLHCVRQACQAILSERTTRAFLADTGKKILSSIIVKARKSPKRFEEVFEEMIWFLEQTEHWENTEMELATRGVKHLNFYDIVLDFVLMDSFEDLENPPISIQNVVNNRWLNSSFKETAVASSCWSVLKQKRQHIKVQDGFIAHFYAVCEQISPVLAWGFLGPKSSLHDFCCFFKDQVLFFLKDIFDLEKVRYTCVEMLAEDMLHLLHRRSELLLAYLGADFLRHLNSCAGAPAHLVPTTLLETRVQ